MLRGYCRFGGEFMDFWSILRFTGRINIAGYLWNLLVRRSYREFGSKKIRKILNSKKNDGVGWRKSPTNCTKLSKGENIFVEGKNSIFSQRGLSFFLF